MKDDNRMCTLAEASGGSQASTDQSLSFVHAQNSQARVTIDVGAQTLEASNSYVAKRWPSSNREENVEAAVYFDDGDEAMLVDRDGHIEKNDYPVIQTKDGCLFGLP